MNNQKEVDEWVEATLKEMEELYGDDYIEYMAQCNK